MSCSRGESCWAFSRKFKSLPSLFLTLVKYFTEESHKPQTVLQIDHWVALCLSESRKDLTLVCTLSHLPSSVITFSLYSHHLSTYAVLLQLRDNFFSMFSVFRSMFTFRFYRLGSRYHEHLSIHYIFLHFQLFGYYHCLYLHCRNPLRFVNCSR